MLQATLLGLRLGQRRATIEDVTDICNGINTTLERAVHSVGPRPNIAY